jgi:hypothetical protein
MLRGSKCSIGGPTVSSTHPSDKQGYSAGEGHQSFPDLPSRNRDQLANGLLRVVTIRQRFTDQNADKVSITTGRLETSAEL